MYINLENFIKKKLDIDVKKLRLLMRKDKEEIQRVLKEGKYNVSYINFQNNSINGVIEKDNKMKLKKLEIEKRNYRRKDNEKK